MAALLEEESVNFGADALRLRSLRLNVYSVLLRQAFNLVKPRDKVHVRNSDSNTALRPVEKPLDLPEGEIKDVQENSQIREEEVGNREGSRGHEV